MMAAAAAAVAALAVAAWWHLSWPPMSSPTGHAFEHGAAAVTEHRRRMRLHPATASAEAVRVNLLPWLGEAAQPAAAHQAARAARPVAAEVREQLFSTPVWQHRELLAAAAIDLQLLRHCVWRLRQDGAGAAGVTEPVVAVGVSGRHGLGHAGRGDGLQRAAVERK